MKSPPLHMIRSPLVQRSSNKKQAEVEPHRSLVLSYSQWIIGKPTKNLEKYAICEGLFNTHAGDAGIKMHGCLDIWEAPIIFCLL